jgi:hypothetical protein
VINSSGVSLELNPDTLILRVPLKILGDPDFILASIKSYGTTLPVDVTAFRRLEVK